jgi:prevent-host-death family protein
MSENNMTTLTVKISDVENQFATLVNEVNHSHTRVIVEKRGVPVAAIISADDLERLSQLDRSREELFKVIDRMREAFKDVPHEEIERETDRIIARNRAANRAAAKKLARTG